MAGAIIDLLTKPELLTKARETFRTEVAGSTYRSLLPPDQKPPVDLNAEEMAKYRDQMKVHYLRADINFK
jgi:aminobenzoyl-glutamate utilization protein B